MSNSKTTPLYNAHKRAGAKIVEFSGWQMPISYSGVIDEHNSVRKAAGIFDVSHMGEVLVTGKEAEAFLNFTTTNDARKLLPGKAQYTIACYANGGTVDDLIIYKLGEEEFLLCVNASNTDKDFSWLKENSSKFNVTLENVSDRYAQIALQGPKAEEILQPLTDADLSSIGSFWFIKAVVGGVEVIIARTGYTGERGFELYTPAASAEKIWDLLLKEGTTKGLKPVGLGARDTLRLEMAYPLYGHELSKDITPIEANLGWVVKIEKGNFLGSARLAEQVKTGTERRLVGIEMLERGIPREGYPLADAGKNHVGYITSGTLSPSLDRPIGLGYLPTGMAKEGIEIFVEIRNRFAKAKVVKTPFLKH